MGCLHFKRPPPAGDADASKGAIGSFEALITQTHGVEDAGAAKLTRWLRETCDRAGVASFYEEGISSSLALSGARRRQLRDAFEASGCVVAAAVARATTRRSDGPLPLTNEVLWAEQHGKPIVLLYDGAKPFQRDKWEAEWPFFFQPASTLVRYYAHGHETCGIDLLNAINLVVDKAGKGAGSTAKASSQVDQTWGVQSSSSGAVDPEAVGDLGSALDVLRAAQELSASTELQDDSPLTKAGILRQRGAGAGPTSGSKPRRRDWNDFRPSEVQEAAQAVVVHLQAGSLGIRDALLCLQAGFGVSERVVARALHVLACHLADSPSCPQQDVANAGTTLAPTAGEVTDWALAALNRHQDSVDVCTSALDAFSVALPLVPGGSLGPKAAERIFGIMQQYPSCQALQRHGLALFACALEDAVPVTGSGDQATVAHGAAGHEEGEEDEEHVAAFALKGGGLARVLTRIGVPDLSLAALGRYHADGLLVVDACRVMQSLASASREVKLLLVSSKASAHWVDVLSHAGPGDAVALATLRLLASLVTDDPEVQNSAGAAVGLLEALERRLSSDFWAGALGLSEAARRLEAEVAEAAEVFGFLCRLTARNVQNKQLILNSGLLQYAVERCRLGAGGGAAAEVRIAASGLLINLCADSTGKKLALEAGARDAARALRECEGNLRRCGIALEQLLSSESTNSHRPLPPPPSDTPTGGGAFEGLFAVRHGAVATRRSGSSAGSGGGVGGGDASKGTEAKAKPVSATRREAGDDGRGSQRSRGPGYHRLPTHTSRWARDTIDPQQPDTDGDYDALGTAPVGKSAGDGGGDGNDGARSPARSMSNGSLIGDWVPGGPAAQPTPRGALTKTGSANGPPLPLPPPAAPPMPELMGPPLEGAGEDDFEPTRIEQPESPRFNDFWGDLEPELYRGEQERRPVRDALGGRKGKEAIRGRLADIRTELAAEAKSSRSSHNPLRRLGGAAGGGAPSPASSAEPWRR